MIKKAPEFSLPNQDGVEISLRDLIGSWIVLYFYPKDNTPGCTTQACDFTSLEEEFRDLEAIVIGVSPDSIKSHKNFITKKSLSIMLLSDESKECIKSYEAWGLKKMYGREYEGVFRSTFIIDPKGNIAKEYRNVKVKGHVQSVKEDLVRLKEEYK